MVDCFRKIIKNEGSVYKIRIPNNRLFDDLVQFFKAISRNQRSDIDGGAKKVMSSCAYLCFAGHQELMKSNSLTMKGH